LRPRDVFDLVVLGAIWGGAFPLLRVAVPAFGTVPLVFVRVGVASVLLILMARGFARLREQAGPLFLLGLLNTAVPFALFAFATLYVTAGLAALLNSTTPMFGALVSYLWLGERLTALRVLGIVIGFAGVGSIVWSQIGMHAEGAALGIAAGLLASAMYGVAANFARRKLETIDAPTVAAGSVLGATLALAPVALVRWPAETPGAGAWIAAVALGLVCTAVAYLIYFRLVRNVGPSKAVTVTFLIPLFGIFWGAVFLDEPVTPALLVSCVLVLAGTALATGIVRAPR
jgi:drug/metabolite transporter (DMT)-like permease